VGVEKAELKTRLGNRNPFGIGQKDIGIAQKRRRIQVDEVIPINPYRREERDERSNLIAGVMRRKRKT